MLRLNLSLVSLKWLYYGIVFQKWFIDNNLIVHSLLINFLNLIKESKAAAHYRSLELQIERVRYLRSLIWIL